MHLKIRILSFCILLISTLSIQISAQTADEKKLLRFVQKYFDEGDYKQALNLYEDLVEINPNKFEYRYEIALIYFHELNQKGKSIEYFNKAKKVMKKDSIPELYFLLAQAYQAEGEYEEAIEQFYYYRDIDSNFLKVNVKRYVEQCNYGIELLNNPDPTIEIINLKHPVNTKFDEFSAINLIQSSELLFTSKNVINMFGELIEANYVSVYDSMTYESPVLINEINKYQDLVIDEEENSSIVSISEDGKRLIIYANSLLYESSFEDGVWLEPKKLDDKINFNYTNRYASFTADGKEVYFSSYDRRNENNIQIFYCKKNEDGTWSNAVELGLPVNTRKNEDAPEISANGDTLYFSSIGHKGMGGYDIFMSVRNDSAWSEPVNMGTPINSPWDDMYYKFDTKTRHGYISSNRKGGQGGMDIYLIKKN